MQFYVRTLVQDVKPGTEELFFRDITFQSYDDDWDAWGDLEPGERIYQVDIEYVDVTDEMRRDAEDTDG